MVFWTGPSGNCCGAPVANLCDPDNPIDFTLVRCRLTASWTGCAAPEFEFALPCADASMTDYVLPDRVGVGGAAAGAWYNAADYNAGGGDPDRVGCLYGFEPGVWYYNSTPQKPQIAVALTCGDELTDHSIMIWDDFSAGPAGLYNWFGGTYPGNQPMPLDTPIIVPVNGNYIDRGSQCVGAFDATVLFELK